MTPAFQPMDHSSKFAQIAFHSGRSVLASLFILGGIDKLMDGATSIDAMTAAGLPAPTLLIWMVIAVELGLGLVVAAGAWVAGGRLVLLAALVLMAHTLAANMLFHDFWNFEDQRARLELSLFFKNVAIMGGLAMVAGLYAPKRPE